MGFISGMRIKALDEKKCVVSVPYKWLNKNPFKSTFWAVLGMGAEMNTAALILQYTLNHKPTISTLPLKCNAEFIKKESIPAAFATSANTPAPFPVEPGIVPKDFFKPLGNASTSD